MNPGARSISRLWIVTLFAGVLAGCGQTPSGRSATPTASPIALKLGQTLTEFALPTPHAGPESITAGPDGNVWFTEHDANKIGRITPAGAVTGFPIPTDRTRPVVITNGPDGALWFTEPLANKIGRITTSGVITEFPLPMPQRVPIGIVAGPDNALWFTETSGHKIGRITPTGALTEFSLAAPAAPSEITSGPDGNL
jgi:virginiamycin B lyase